MAEYPALPLWTDAYLTDTAHLTNEEHGVYLRLLMYAWRTPDCSLPDDDRRLAIMVGVTPRRWAALRAVIAPFWRIEDGRWTQKRLTAEHDSVRQKSNSRRAAAEARWEAKSLKNHETGHANAVRMHMRNGMQTRCKSDASGDRDIVYRDVVDRENVVVDRENVVDGDADASPNYIDHFDAFWALAPRRVAKLAARKAFAKALKRAAPETIIEGMRRYAASRAGQDPRYTAHPATWLNAGRWEDEPDAAGSQHQLPATGDRHDAQLAGGSDRERRRIEAFVAGATRGLAGR